MADIEGMRPRLANRGLDLPVTVPIVLLLGLAARRFTRWLDHRFEADEWIAWMVASLIGSLIIPTVVVGVGMLWAMLVEVVRVGNEHVGYRAVRRTEGLRATLLVMFGVGIAATWIGSAASMIGKRARRAVHAIGGGSE
jgi:hypothetical protein